MQNVGSLSVSMGANSLLIVPAGFNPYTDFGSYSSLGMTHTAGTTLVVPTGQGFGGWGSINDPVDCQGTISVSLRGSEINLNNGLTLSGSGTVALGAGYLTINDTTSSISGGSLAALRQYVGKGGTGVFIQSGGTNTVCDTIFGIPGTLYLGYSAGDFGTYSLGGAGVAPVLTTDRTYVGYGGTGNFTQSGGTNTEATNLYLGYHSGSNGTYTLSGAGQLFVNTLYVGESGTGTFTQSNGINTIDYYLWIGRNSGSNGTYNLSGTGLLTAYREYIGHYGTGNFTQTGGTNTVSSILRLAYNSSVSGTYNLNGGMLILKSLSKGHGSAAFNFGGGTLQASDNFSTTLPMTLTGIGGDANVDTAGYAVMLSGQLSGTGGLNKLGNSTLTLSTTNTYGGPTTISAGTLALGSAASLASSLIHVGEATFDVSAKSGGYNLGASQTLTGSGKVLGNLTVYGIHAPGSSPGIQIIEGDYNMFGQLQMELVGTTVGTGYDQVLLSGPGSYDANLGGTLTLDGTSMSGSSASTQLWILRNDTGGTFSGTFSNYANGALLGKYDGRNWAVWYGADAASGSLAGGNDVLVGALPISPALALPVDYTGPRVMRDSSGTLGNSAIAVVTAGEVAGGFSLASTGTNALNVTPTAGTVPASDTNPVPFAFGWVDTSTTGAKSGEITLTNLSDPLDPNNHLMSVAGAVLDPRRLRVTTGSINFGNVLRGATVSADFVVNSTNRNPDSDHTTMVRVAPGGASLGQLTVGETVVSAGGPVYVPVSGTFDAYGSDRARDWVPVATAEAPDVQDATAYRSLFVRYTANVGLARFGRRPTEFDSSETVLSATVAAGGQLTNLSSKVNPRGTLAMNPTPASSIVGSASLWGLYGAVGSQAEIVTSTSLAAETTVTMQWRKRLRDEANFHHTPPSPTLPNGCGWLVSDVVRIGGIDDDTTYALQMSFDNRINLVFDGPIDGTVANEFPDLYLAEFDSVTEQWTNAALLYTPGAYAQPGIFQSLTDFLTDNAAVDLAELTGSWGVDPVADALGLGHSWTIVSGGGSSIFAVDLCPSASLGALVAVPEPATWLLLLSAAVVLLVYVRRGREDHGFTKKTSCRSCV